MEHTVGEHDDASNHWAGGEMSQDDFMNRDKVIVVNYKDNVKGSCSKAKSHKFDKGQPRGILHRAFSVFLFDSDGRLLLQQRALDKITFPGVWTNTCCSHQLTGCEPCEMDSPEDILSGKVPGAKNSAVRKMEHELGIPLGSILPSEFKFLTRLHYYASDTMTHGLHSPWGEHEIDYILFVKVNERPKMDVNQEEVSDTAWVSKSELLKMMQRPDLMWSPWFVIIAQRWLIPLWWDDLNEILETSIHVDTKSITRFDPPSAYRAGRGVCGPPPTSQKQVGGLKKQGAYGKICVVPSSTRERVVSMFRLEELALKLRFVWNERWRTVLRQNSGDDDENFGYSILNRVSRSFASVIQILPDELRLSILVFYLALRGLDTIEDDMDSFPDHESKVTCLRLFYKTLLVGNVKELMDVSNLSKYFPNGEGGGMVGVGLGDEAILLSRYPSVALLFHRLPLKYSEVISDITKRMGEGMCEFVTQQLDEGTKTMAEYDLYCHYVAGLVGEGLSRIFSVEIEGENVLEAATTLANSMGLVLQKTNIIRDFLEDYVDGRTFWPKEIWSKHSKTGRLGEFILPEHRTGGVHCLNEMVTNALEHFPESFQYMELIKHPEVFRFCALPQVQAIATLAAVYNNASVYEGVVKIRKGIVLKMMNSNLTNMACFARWVEQFVNEIQGKIPTSDPSAMQTQKACIRLLEMSCKYQNGKRGLNGSSSLKWIGLSVTTSVAAVALVAIFRRPKLLA